jgi:hypothetical protein
MAATKINSEWAKSAHANQFKSLAKDEVGKDKQYTTEQECNTQLVALPVLDHASEKTLEHRQLRKNPYYKEICDKSYTNKLGRLCQDIGAHPTVSQRKS